MHLIVSLSLALPLFSAVLATAISAAPEAQSGFVKRAAHHHHRHHARAPVKPLPEYLKGELKSCTTKNCFGLSFDDGPHIYHKEVSDIVHTAGYNATYFLNGNNYGCIYDEANVQALRKSLAQGHTLCSHTWGHVHLNEMSHQKIVRQVTLLETAMNKTLGVVPRCLRPPYGESNETTTRILNELGLAVINWSVDSGDSFDPPATVKKQLELFRSFSYAADQRNVLLQHEVYEQTARQVLPKAVKILAKNGFYPTSPGRLSTVQGVGTIFNFPGLNPYKERHAPQQRDHTWTCDDKPPQAA